MSYNKPEQPPPSYPSPVHDAGPYHPNAPSPGGANQDYYNQGNQGYPGQNYGPPPQGYGYSSPHPQGQQMYYPPQGYQQGYQQGYPQGYQQPPPPQQQQGYHAGDRGTSAGGGFCAGLMAALACCCCLDLLC